jgi:3-oxoacyl-[acyl-carrier protein] reductase
MSENIVALVTGGSRGIGGAIALRLALDGYDVAVNYLSNQEGAEEVTAKIVEKGWKARSYKTDVADYAAVEKMVSDIDNHMGPVGVLINNAGVYQRSTFSDLSLDDWQRTIDVNLTGCFNSAKAVVPGMLEREEGNIVNVSSMLGFKGTSHGAHYAASKSGVIAFTKSLALELSPHGIRVNAVAPGAIETEIIAYDSPEQRQKRIETTPARKVGQPEEIASVVSFLVSEESSYMTGETLHANGGYLMV